LNTRLLILALALMILGLLSGLLPVLVIGFVLLLPALFIGGRSRGAEQPKAEPPKPNPQPEGMTTFETNYATTAPAMQTMMTPEEPPQPALSYSAATPALFPYPILPTLNPVNVASNVAPEQKGDNKEELMELAFLLGLNWLASRLRD
jgi:hypothetical protein